MVARLIAKFNSYYSQKPLLTTMITNAVSARRVEKLHPLIRADPWWHRRLDCSVHRSIQDAPTCASDERRHTKFHLVWSRAGRFEREAGQILAGSFAYLLRPPCLRFRATHSVHVVRFPHDTATIQMVRPAQQVVPSYTSARHHSGSSTCGHGSASLCSLQFGCLFHLYDDS